MVEAVKGGSFLGESHSAYVISGYSDREVAVARLE
jgi:hypothetical protein